MIYVEDLPHQRLLLTLGVGRKRIIVKGPKYEVGKSVEKYPDSIGLIDEDSDKGSPQPRILNKLRLKNQQHNLKIYVGERRRIVVISPATIEDWILKICLSYGLNPKTEFGLENDPRELKKVINRRLDKFGDLVKKLLELKDPALYCLRKEMLE